MPYHEAVIAGRGIVAQETSRQSRTVGERRGISPVNLGGSSLGSRGWQSASKRVGTRYSNAVAVEFGAEVGAHTGSRGRLHVV